MPIDKNIFDNPKAFRQQVRLAAVQVAALGEDELAAALAYELEPFSKIPSSEAAVAWRESAESTAAVKVYDVAVVRRRAGKGSGGSDGERRWNIIVAAVALLAVVAVAVDWFAMASRIDGLRRDVAAQMPLDEELRRLDDRVRNVHAEAAAIREKRQSAERAHGTVESLRSSLTGALDAVAAVCGGRIVVKEISSPEHFVLEFRAAAESAENAAAIMAQLGDAVVVRGLRLESGAISASSTGTMVEFTFRLRPSNLQTFGPKEVL